MAVMHSYTRGEIREKLVRRVRGYYPRFTVAAATSAGTFTSYDATMLGEGARGSRLIGYWIMLTSGDYAGEVAHITHHSVALGVATISYSVHSFGGNALRAGTKGFFLQRNPEILHDVIDDACLELFPALHVPITDESMTVGGLLANPSLDVLDADRADHVFQEWDSPTTLVSASDLAIHGRRCAMLQPSELVDNLEQTLEERLAGVRTGAAHIAGCFVNAPEEQSVTIRLYDEDDNELGAHTNGRVGLWELLEVQGQDAVKVGIRYDGDGTALVDAAYCYSGIYYRYALPDTFINWPHAISVQRDIYYPNGPFTAISGWRRVPQERGEKRYVVIDEFSSLLPFRRGHYLRFEGRAPVGRALIEDDADDDSIIEVNGPQSEVLVEQAAYLAKMRWAAGTNYDAAQELRRQAKYHMEHAQELLGRSTVREPMTMNPVLASKRV